MKAFRSIEFDNVKIELAKTLQQLKAAISMHSDSTVVISSEYLYSMCSTTSKVSKLKNLLECGFEEIEIVL
jgi:hypothetical protein